MAQIRGAFPLPITSPQTTGSPSALYLAAGQVYIPPPGEYLIQTGDQTVVQIYDQQGGQWRNFSPPMSFAQLSMDGFNYRLINLSGVCVGAFITAAGSAGTNGIGPLQTGAAVTFGAAPSGGRVPSAYPIVGGSVPAPTVTQAGSGFLVPPLIVCDPPPLGGIQATFACTLTYSTGAINTVTQVNAGAGYTSVPQFYVIPMPQYYQGANQYPPIAGTAPPSSGGAGGAGLVPAPGLINPANAWGGFPYQANLTTSGATTGALLTGNALTGSGTLTGIVFTDYGAGYAGNTTPSITITGLTSATATPIMSYAATAAIGGTVTCTGGTGGVTGAPAISTLGGTSGQAQKQINNSTYFPRPMRGTVNASAGSFALEDPGFGLEGGAVNILAYTTTSLIVVTNTQYGGRGDVSIITAMAQ